MAKNNALNFNLPSADDLFSTEESRAEARLEKVINLNPSEISDFPNHPFKVRMDAAMQEMTESVKQYGVLVPALVRPKPDGGYEMVAGHRRKKAAELANLTEIPCIVRQLTDDEATIIMVDSNLQREQILPSEKAFAYKMKLDAMKRQGQRTDLTLSPVATKLDTAAQLGRQSGESRDQVFRFIRLTNLIPEILELVDNSVLKDPETLQIALRPAVELSYLKGRGISMEVLDFCVQTGRIYESRNKGHGNVVFVGFDKTGKARFGCLRGISEGRFHGDLSGSDKHYSFALPACGKNPAVHLCECAIDVMSYASLCRLDGIDWKQHNLLSLAGVYQPKKKIAESKLPVALTRFLEDYPHVKTVYLHLDNDGPGRMAAEAIQTVISKEYEVKNCPPPRGKDVNDYLCRRLGIPIRGAKGKEQER